MWMLVARVDEAASTSNTVGNRVGDRLTKPKAQRDGMEHLSR